MTGLRGRTPADQRRLLAEAGRILQTKANRPIPWSVLARPEQLPPPGMWLIWLIMTGRGWGKTRTAAETIAAWARAGMARSIIVIAQTADELRDVAMRALRDAAGADVTYEPSKRFRIRWPNGAEAIGFSAMEPRALRGHQCDALWCDELAAYRDPDVWDEAQLCLRIGIGRSIITTTPRPIPLLRRLVADPTVYLTRGHMADNQANLTPALVRRLIERFEGTTLGRQELDGELLLDLDGALWSWDRLEALRVQAAPPLVRTLVAVDPATTSRPTSDETGIVVVGKSADHAAYVLDDRSGRFGPKVWALQAVLAAREFGANAIVAEANQGGDLVESVIRTIDPTIAYEAVHATVGGRARAEPIAMLYEQGRVHHVGRLPQLEDQLCAALPGATGGPDDRLDALVWGLTALDLTAPVGPSPAQINWQYGGWYCLGCGHLYPLEVNQRCPKCGMRAPDSNPEPT